MERDAYLPEDHDLLDALESVGEVSTGMALSQQERKISVIHIKTLLRSRKAAADSSRTTDRFSVILAAFAVVQIFVALSQLLYDAGTGGHIGIGLAILALLVVGIIAVTKFYDPDKLLKK